MRELKDGIRSFVKLDFTGKVHKTFRGTDRQERFDQEVKVLKYLEERGCEYVPKLLESHPDELRIVTTNCGAPAPHLSERKAKTLFDALEHDYGVIHDDPFPRNITYSPHLGRFCIIDFELATIVDAIPDQNSEESDIWRITWSASSKKGSTHTANDDAFLVCTVGEDGANKRESRGEHFLDPAHILFLVSDGMGGKNAGELASRLIANYVHHHAQELFDRLAANPDDLSPIETMLSDCHKGLLAIAADEEKANGMGATATLCWLTPGHMHFAHLGDSRLYLHRAGETTQLTKDHTMAWNEWQRHGYSEYQFRNHPRLSVLYECLGAGRRNIHPQVETVALEKGDRLMLCTDGVTDGLWHKHIHEELCRTDIDENATAISARAIDNAGKDDTTLIVVDVE